ncbi:hypothetical protein J8F10_37395 [Gemmata sp. G18]|uniref:Uncharacterized protein n=1 Tax=Gemmata palustris TaxID=2822762 RepID=A0ABS5BMN7_9BACT|nr:hypothetical protein [Gemmata palustris]MBP3954966.1 hypothetical protein [Gemmata palustris]MBP3960931.1 hypothetical protein [Gemmata palustris]
MSVLTVNGIRFHLLKSASVQFDTKRDSVGGTDVVCNTSTIRARGIASLQSTIPTNSALLLADIRHMLNMPRRSIYYEVNGVPIIQWQPIDGRPDADLGPNPIQPATITEINPGTFFIDVGYKISTYDCGNNALTDPVVSLRWEQSESFDELNYSHISTHGKLVVRGDLLQSADNFRDQVTPPILPDYKRKSAKYTLHPNGTELAFSFDDMEQAYMPPFPALDWNGRFTIECPKPGFRRTGRVELTLTGQKGTSRKDLLNVAMSMCYSKLRSERFESVPMAWGSFSEDLKSPSVQVAMQAQLSPVGGFTAGLIGAAAGAAIAALGKPPGPAVMPSVGQMPGIQEGRPGLAPPIRKRLTALVAAVFKDPCAAAEVIVTELRSAKGGDQPNREMLADAETRAAGFELTIGDTTLSTRGATAYTDTAPYETYELTSSYAFDTGVVMMPATGVGPNGKKAKAVTVHGGAMTLEVDWVAMRTGAPPVLPTFESKDPNFVPLRGGVTVSNVELSPDGVMPVHKVAGHYSYGVIDPTIVSLAAPIPPFLSPQLQDVSLSTTRNFSDEILWAGAPVNRGQTPFTGDGILTGGGQPQDPLSGGARPAVPGSGLQQDPGSGGLPGLGSGSGGILGGNPVVYP